MASMAIGSNILVTVGTPIKLKSSVAVAIGNVVYKVAASGKLALAIATSVVAAEMIGVAVSACSAADQDVLVLPVDGEISGTNTLVLGQEYMLSHTVAGQICLPSDLAGSVVHGLVGIANTTTSLRLKIFSGGVLHA